jgi:hypothetical protein
MRMDAQGAPVLSGTFSWESNDSRMIFTPSDALVDYSPYECQVGTGAMDISSNHLASEYSWTFVTGNAGGISGRISYSGSSEPTSVGIGIFTTPCFSGQSVADGAIPLPGDYLIYPLAPGTYYVGAYMDLDANSEPSLGEPAGIYDTNGDWNADPVVVQAGRTSTGKDFSLDYEFKMSTISGDVGKEPSVVNSDTTYVLCFDQNPSGPEEVEAVGGAIIAEGTGAYTTTPLFFGCYYVICFMDTNHNRELDVDPGTDLPVEPVGLYGFINGYGEPIFYSIFLLDDVWDIDMTLFYMDASPAPPSLASVLGRVSVRELLFSK